MSSSSFLKSLLEGDRHRARALVLDALRSGASIQAIFLEILQPSQYELGRLWHEGEITIAEEHFCTAATIAIMAQLQPRIFERPRNGLRLVAASVEGELHEIGVRMIADLLEIEGWDSYFLGGNNPADTIVSAVKGRQAQLLCLSVSIAALLPSLEAVIPLIRTAFPSGEVKILVGGAPFNAQGDLWRRIGADATARDAAGALEYATSLAARDSAGEKKR